MEAHGTCVSDRKSRRLFPEMPLQFLMSHNFLFTVLGRAHCNHGWSVPQGGQIVRYLTVLPT